jgi:hypothetical protein
MQENFEVTKILDGNTFEVKPFWKWEDENGVFVRATGYNAPGVGEPGYEDVKNQLMELLFGEQVTLKHAVAIEDDALICEVHIDGKNLAEYFPSYQE